MTRVAGVGGLEIQVDWGVATPRFLFEASYTLDGVKGVQSAGGTSRRDAVAQVAESVGGQLESFYFAFGDRDAYVIVDLPDHGARRPSR